MGKMKELAMKEPDETWQFLKDYCHWITLNANDTFGWACADCVDVDVDDIPKLQQIERKYGHDGVIAFMAKIRQCDPISPRINDKYKEAKKELESYTLLKDLGIEDKEKWNNWWKEYYLLTGENVEGEYLG